MAEASNVVSSLQAIWILTLVAFVVGRLAEWSLHRRNYAMLRAMGADEQAPWAMRGYYAVTVLVVPAAFLEFYLAPSMPSRGMLMLGGMMAGIAILLRFWAIRSLGVLWTMRCIALPGMRPRALGPYRIVNNPEYLSRLIEGAGVCLLIGAEITLTVYVVLSTVYGLYLAELERQQLANLAAEEKAQRLGSRPVLK